TYRMPLVAKKWFLDLRYDYESEKRENTESTFDFDAVSQTYADFNFALSTDFINKNRVSTPSAKVVYNSEKMNVSFGSGYSFRTIENKDRLRPELSLERQFEFLQFDANFNYRFSPKMSLYFDYGYDNDAPAISQ